MGVKPIPEGYHSISPSLAVDNAAAAIDFYKRAFGANERLRMDGPGGTIAHAEIEIGDSVVMLADPSPQAGERPPTAIGGTSVGIFTYIEDIDTVFKRAIDAGATSNSEPENMFWGDRFGTLTDPYGHVWHLATHVEDLTPEQIDERAKEFAATIAGG
jgi:PhnB protein